MPITSPPLLVLYPYIPPLATRILGPSTLTLFGTCCTPPLSAATWRSKSFVSPPLCQGHTDLPECAEFDYELDCPEEHADECLESPGMLIIHLFNVSATHTEIVNVQHTKKATMTTRIPHHPPPTTRPLLHPPISLSLFSLLRTTSHISCRSLCSFSESLFSDGRKTSPLLEGEVSYLTGFLQRGRRGAQEAVGGCQPRLSLLSTA